MVNGRKPAVPPKPKSKPKDPVEVYCRIRPIKEPNDEVCAMPIGDTIVQLSPPSTAQPSKNGMVKEVSP